MRSVLSLLIVLVIAFGIYYLYSKQLSPASGGSPAENISTTGVKADLLSIAQAERVFFAQNGRYAALAELTSSGALSVPRNVRDGYTYSVETSEVGFTVTARFASSEGGSSAARRPTLVIDQTMQVHEAN